MNANYTPFLENSILINQEKQSNLVLDLNLSKKQVQLQGSTLQLKKLKKKNKMLFIAKEKHVLQIASPLMKKLGHGHMFQKTCVNKANTLKVVFALFNYYLNCLELFLELSTMVKLFLY